MGGKTKKKRFEKSIMSGKKSTRSRQVRGIVGLKR